MKNKKDILDLISKGETEKGVELLLRKEIGDYSSYIQE
jgi:hypothetical protein